MNRFSLYLIILLYSILLSGCHDDIEPPIDPTPPQTEAERTVIVYMAADNSLNGAVGQDMAEMIRGKDQIPENVNFLIYLDDRKLPAIYELSAKRGTQLWKQYDEEHCSTDSTTMLSILREIEQAFPARHYGLSLWSHATGWAPRRNTFGKDENRGNASTDKPDEMEIPVLRDVLARLPKFDYIFFDACFMQSIEVAYELRDVTDWMIGSPAEIPGPGAPYDKIMNALCQGDVEGIVRGYDSAYPDYPYTGVLLSCIDCSKLELLAETTGHLLTPFFTEHTEPSVSGFQPYSTYIHKYTYCFDMRTTMRRLLSDEDYAAWMEAFNEAVPLRTLSDTHTWYANTSSVSRVYDPECYGGVSMFVPLSAYNAYGWNEDFQNTSWYKATGWQATGW
ncbi:MAG: hypothetical protein J1F27_01015 [Prevotellaceae bacterium]|nr:hypothetical protein [Prevotellaceae bacterium]